MLYLFTVCDQKILLETNGVLFRFAFFDMDKMSALGDAEVGLWLMVTRASDAG